MLFIESNEEASQYFGRKPWENTIAYYPLDSQSALLDKSWNWYNLTKNWNITFGENQGVNCANYMNWGYLYNTSIWISNNVITFNFRVWCSNTTTSHYSTRFSLWTVRWRMLSWRYNSKHNGSKYVSIWELWQPESLVPWDVWEARHHIACVWNWSWWILYIDWNQITTTWVSSYTKSEFYIWKNPNDDEYLIGYISKMIVENKARTQSEVQEYYEKTKKKYGLS